MKRFVNFTLLLSLLALGGLTAFGQDDEYHKVEGAILYSHERLDTGIGDDDEFDFDDFDNTLGMHGVNASITGNVHKYVGLKLDFATHSRSRNFSDGTDSLRFKVRNTQVLGGIQVRDNRKEGGRARPFFHVMGGLAHQRVSASGAFTTAGTGGGTGPGGEGTGPIITNFDESESFNNFAMVIGGGLDVNVSPRVALRLIQLDYNPVWMRSRNTAGFDIGGHTQNNFRIGIGVVFH